MVSKCANPNCSKLFRYLHEGKLFHIDMPCVAEKSSFSPDDEYQRKPPRHAEFFWLCNECAEQMTLNYRRGFGVRTVPLHGLRARAAAL